MLIEFSVTNYRSVLEKQTLSMAAASANKLEDSHTFSTGIKRLPNLLKSAAIYGPNAAGKSNILRAIHFMRSLILFAATESQEGDPTGVTPFLFDKTSANEPSEFEISFIQNNIRYQYGFAVTNKIVVEEWLFAFPKGKQQLWFNRRYEEKSKNYDWNFGNHLKGKKHDIAGKTRDNALFLSTAAQWNLEQLKAVYLWFKYELTVLQANRPMPTGYTDDLCESDEGKGQVESFLKEADPGISKLLFEEKYDSIDDLIDNLPAEIPAGERESIRKRYEGAKFVDIKTSHQITGSDKEVHLDLYDESDGTKNMYALAGPIINVLRDGEILCIDELDTSLHPLLVRMLIGLFNSAEHNRNNAQLIFTTHDTSQLNKDVFRRDQIWFVEKDDKNSTQLYSLLEFSPRKEEAFEKGYLHGRYGALPFFGGLEI